MNLNELKELIKLLRDSDIEELELEKSGFRVRLKKKETYSYSPAKERDAIPVYHPAEAEESPVAAEEEKDGKKLVTITSPIVGTFYRAPSPDASPYAEVGDSVKKGQILCVVEAMKLMNEIESDVDGRIQEILAENAHPVEYGEPLFLIEPSIKEG
ncbi:MAG: acetyl-CoA carboxylase biotin carboxyl carrier protein [Nitrospirae bacterium]|nr:acetyl-CoA carboxylase biotin carboxyl carrier protein [Nitrospirota bacterium]